MLRVVTQSADALAELQRIRDRIYDDQMVHREATVREILQKVKRLGDQALIDYTAEFDGQVLGLEDLRVSGAELDAAYQHMSPELLAALRLAQQRIEDFHRRRLPQSWVCLDDYQNVLGRRYTPVERAGLYIPGGRAAYPSTVLMNVIPAKAAGVTRIVLVTPPGPQKQVNPAVLVAAQECGVTEIYRVGGAQAVGALAYGTATIPKVDVICGPGNLYVTLAKKLVYGTVGIDSLAGPSEVLIIADHTARPDLIAADLLAQAEHDPLAAAILLTPDLALARQVVADVAYQLQDHPRRTLTEKAIAHYGLVVVVNNLEEAAGLANEFAPEHLEIATAAPWDILPLIKHAGAIFLGHNTPEAVGDYLAGPNHTLPTSGAARYASGLSAEVFLKASSLIEFTPAGLSAVAEAVQTLAVEEGLFSHGESVRLRVEPPEDGRPDRK